MRHCLAYGSNLSVDQMALRCPDARVVGTAAVEGFPRYYVKGDSSVRVTSLDGRDLGEVEAMAYVMSEGYGEVRPPDDDYRAVLEEGYETFRFDFVGLDQALEESLVASGEGILCCPQ